MARQRGTVATILPRVEGPGRDPGAVPGQDWHCRAGSSRFPPAVGCLCVHPVSEKLMVCVHGCVENWKLLQAKQNINLILVRKTGL